MTPAVDVQGGARYSYDDSTSEPIMLHFDGDEWTRTQLPAQTGTMWQGRRAVLRLPGPCWTTAAC